MTLSFPKLFFTLAFIFGLFAVMVLARPVLIPLSMALLISFILFPVVQKLEAWGINRLFAAFLSLLMMFLILGGFLTLFSTQIMNLSDQLSDFSIKIMDTLTDVIVYVNGNIHFIGDLNREELIEDGKTWLQESSGTLLQSTFSTTATLFTGVFTTIIFTFLILIYRDGLTKAFVSFGDEANKGRIFKMLQNIQRVGKQYLSGMFILILILGFANSIGLLLIGIDSPFLFGFLAAFLSIVPFVGTTIGAVIPVLYAFMSSDSLLVPVAVVIWFWAIQVIESNFLNPKIVGSSLNVNALVAILSLLVGAAVWGVAGMILFLPFAAILKVICEEFDQLRPIAMLISDDISGDEKKVNKPSKWVEKVKGWFK
ncbi:AI-2E family transporter [Aquiflexum sp. TKW24L]|uniref:AI-2E family transporter n=1 Tax=Aquiflexum sp. TKW24L TaxID=2942212 RepID=UPI0020BE1DF8|nr:AI-2E family transporter [Aquiflexum sp. TKW24L]MCL6260925.1 AI-2E family transporter [Aquiflexum sp. TKW24L]